MTNDKHALLDSLRFDGFGSDDIRRIGRTAMSVGDYRKPGRLARELEEISLARTKADQEERLNVVMFLRNKLELRECPNCEALAIFLGNYVVYFLRNHIDDCGGDPEWPVVDKTRLVSYVRSSL